jgi:hypothetical protein
MTSKALSIGLLLTTIYSSAIVAAQAQTQTPAQPQINTASEPKSTASLAKLGQLNSAFRQFYAHARKQALEANNPVIICIGDHLELHDGDQETSAPVVPEQYTVLKTVDHVPLAIFSVLTQPATGDNPNSAPTLLSKAQAADLRSIIDLVKAASPELNAYLTSSGALSKITIERQSQILDKSLNFAESVLKAGETNETALRSFTRSLRVPLLANAAEAISAQLSAIDKVVGQWKQNLGKDKWQKLKVVIISGHMPRNQHATLQYFCKVLKQSQEGERIIYAEGALDEADALTLLATHDLDRSVAVNFFVDKWRMHRDLLSDGAAHYIKHHQLAAQD